MDQLKLMMQQQAQQAAQQQQNLEAMMKGHEQVYTTLNTQADTMNKLREAMGLEQIASPEGMEAFQSQAGIIGDQQEKMMGDYSNEELMEIVRNG
jgi:hypothetical protein